MATESIRHVFFHDKNPGEATLLLQERTKDTERPIRPLPFFNRSRLATQNPDGTWFWEEEKTRDTLVAFRDQIIAVNAVMLDWEKFGDTPAHAIDQRINVHHEICHFIRTIHPNIDIGWFRFPDQASHQRHDYDALWLKKPALIRGPTALFLQCQTKVGPQLLDYFEDIHNLVPNFISSDSSKLYAYLDASIAGIAQTKEQIIARIQDISIVSPRSHIVFRDKDPALADALGFAHKWLKENPNNPIITTPV